MGNYATTYFTGVSRFMEILMFFTITLSVFAHDAGFEKAIKSYKSQHYKAAYQLWKKSAKKGDAIALYNLAVMELNLQGESASFKASAVLFRQACHKKFGLACVELGLMHELGIAVKKSVKEAFKLYLKAAQQGDPLGQNKLAEYYENRDIKKAIYWFKKSAEQNIIASASSLGLIYQKKKEWSASLFWFQKSVGQDFKALIKAKKDPFLADGKTLNHLRGMGYRIDTSIDEALFNAQFDLGYFYEHMKSEYQSKKLARFWYEKSALQGFALAQHNLAYLYIKGEGGKKDYIKAKYWYEKAAEQNHSRSMYNLAYIYENGLGAAQNALKAIELYKKVHGEHEALAFKSIAVIYDRGIGLRKDEKSALIWYVRAASKNQLYAQVRVADIYFNYRNYDSSFYWFYKAAKSDVSYAQYMVGQMLYKGKGTKQDKQKAKKWFTRAAKGGNNKALQSLKKYQFD